MRGNGDGGRPGDETGAFWGECARLRPGLIGMAGRCGAAGDAEDIVHEAFVLAAGRPGLDLGTLAPYLVTAVERLCVDDRRRRSAVRRAASHPRLLPPQAIGPEERATERDEARWLLGHRVRLTERESFVLLGLAQGMTHQEIARRLGTTRRATECIASRARLRVRDLMASRVRAARAPGR
jgi:DNA-directed RNA polymerase specialized sigma24 family protein